MENGEVSQDHRAPNSTIMDREGIPSMKEVRSLTPPTTKKAPELASGSVPYSPNWAAISRRALFFVSKPSSPLTDSSVDSEVIKDLEQWRPRCTACGS